VGEISHMPMSLELVGWGSSPGSAAHWGGMNISACNARHGSKGATVGRFDGVAQGGFLGEVEVWMRERLKAGGGFCSHLGVWLPWLEERPLHCPRPGEQSRELPRPGAWSTTKSSQSLTAPSRRMRGGNPHRVRRSKASVRSSCSEWWMYWEKESGGSWSHRGHRQRVYAITRNLKPAVPLRSRIVNCSDQQWLLSLARMFSETP
jgi:hypothetical protein